jgi:hypothetical protein
MLIKTFLVWLIFEEIEGKYEYTDIYCYSDTASKQMSYAI